MISTVKWLLLMAALVCSAQYAVAQAKTDAISVKPGLPSYLRQGDHTELSTWIQNNSDHEITGQVQLELIDGTRKQSVDGWFLNTFPNQYFTVPPGKSEEAKFPVQVPMQFSNPLSWRISVAWDSSRVQTTGSLSILADKNAGTEDTSSGKKAPAILTKKMFLVKETASGRKSIPVDQLIALQVGDTVEVQLELRSTTTLKQVHIKDGLAAATKLLAELSNNQAGYQIETGASFVELTFNRVEKGTLRLHYFLLVTAAGNFSTGNTSLEFNSAPAENLLFIAQRLNIE